MCLRSQKAEAIKAKIDRKEKLHTFKAEIDHQVEEKHTIEEQKRQQVRVIAPPPGMNDSHNGRCRGTKPLPLLRCILHYAGAFCVYHSFNRNFRVLFMA